MVQKASIDKDSLKMIRGRKMSKELVTKANSIRFLRNPNTFEKKTRLKLTKPSSVVIYSSILNFEVMLRGVWLFKTANFILSGW